MSASFAGITVPEGEPGALEGAAAQFGSLAGALSGVAGELRGMPGSLSSWSGPASVSYTGACMTNSTACDTAVEALGQAERAARVYANRLRDAKQRAREAIEDARDAQQRIDQAEREIAAARDRQAAASDAAYAASHQIAIAMAAGVPATGAEATRSQAESDMAAAASDEARARRELARARDDLERAQRRGHEAMDDARDAGRAAAGAFAGTAGTSPVYAMLGGLGAAAGAGASAWWNTRNEGQQWWDEDQFLSQLFFFHPKNDEIGRYKWWGDQALNVGSDWASGAAVGYGAALRQAAIRTMPTVTLQYGRYFVSGPGGTVLVRSLTATRSTTTVIDSALLSRAGSWSRAGRAIPIAGGALAIGGAGWDQWRADASNPNLTTTDRVGRAVGVGTYVGGASIAGAAIGTAIFPGVGTVAGLAIGAGAGLLAGAAASSFTPLKDAAAAAGQWTANAAVDTWNWSGDRLSDLGSGISQGADWVRDNVPDIDIDLPDIDMPDLNPF